MRSTLERDDIEIVGTLRCAAVRYAALRCAGAKSGAAVSLAAPFRCFLL